MKHSDGIVWQIHHPPYTLGSELMVWVGSQSLWEPGEKNENFSGHKKAVEHMNSWQGWLVMAGTRTSHVEFTMDHGGTHKFPPLHVEVIDNWWLGRKESKFCSIRWSPMAVHETVGDPTYMHL